MASLDEGQSINSAQPKYVAPYLFVCVAFPPDYVRAAATAPSRRGFTIDQIGGIIGHVLSQSGADRWPASVLTWKALTRDRTSINLTLFQSNRCHRHKLIRAALMQLDGPNEAYEMIPTRASPPISTLCYATTLS
jgi:hypothetical protein